MTLAGLSVIDEGYANPLITSDVLMNEYHKTLCHEIALLYFHDYIEQQAA